jgi:type VI secretion system protein ImpG
LFSKYYQAELAYFRETGRDFGRANPALAGLLSERGGDPDAERLLEGVAFLTARIRERSEAALPELVEGLVDLILPQYLRPLPACSIVEFTPQIRAMRGALSVPRGTEVAAKPVEGTSCTFRTTSELTLLPLAVHDVGVEYPSSTNPILRVALTISEAGLAELRRVGKLRFFLHGELPLSSTLYLWMLRHCQGVELRDPADRAPGVRLPAQNVSALGLEPEEALFQWPRLTQQAPRLLQEFFTLPQKFLFFELSGLEAAPSSRDRLEIVFHFDRPPALPSKVGRDAVRLYCVPVVNLFNASGEPLRVSGLEEGHLLRPAGVNPRHAEVYAVDSVTGAGTGRGDRREYASFVAFSHLPKEAYYRLHRSISPVDGGLDTSISLGTSLDSPPEWPELKEQTLSTELTCTHRSLPAQLGVGDLCVATRTSPALAQFTNLLPISQPIRPPLGSELHWRLLSALALSRLSLGGKDELRAMLELYNFQVDTDQPLARANSMRIGAIRTVESARQRSLVQGASIFGQRTRLEMEEAGFAGPGDLFVFGQILDRLFASNLGVNSFHELAVQSFPSRMEHVWPPRSGTQPLI